MIHLSF
ncbi:hypothetical protein LINGRAHAP2_LOCUS23022 [Linum grandiflorum]